jgi:hypothetical protein
MLSSCLLIILLNSRMSLFSMRDISLSEARQDMVGPEKRSLPNKTEKEPLNLALTLRLEDKIKTKAQVFPTMCPNEGKLGMYKQRKRTKQKSKQTHNSEKNSHKKSNRCLHHKPNLLPLPPSCEEFPNSKFITKTNMQPRCRFNTYHRGSSTSNSKPHLHQFQCP